MAKIIVKDQPIKTINRNGVDYISLTDIAKKKNDTDPNGVIANWMRNRNTIEFLGIWETLYNTSFNPLEFEGFRKEAGLNAFTLSPTKWIEATNAIGMLAIIRAHIHIALCSLRNTKIDTLFVLSKC